MARSLNKAMRKDYLRPMTCMDCETEVQLAKDQDGRLHVSCECDSRSIKVAKKTPESWA